MKQVININFQGRVVPIEVSAFELLKSYTDSLARYFANEEGKDEIINDIESRIGELFQERLKKGATCITDEDVNAIIKNMGRPEEFAGDEEKVASGLGSESSSKSSSESYNTHAGTTTQKRLYRDENNKVLGGVCGGLANYFGTDPVIIRVIFAVVALAFGTGLLAYVIMWIAVPSSASTEIGGYRKKLFRDPDDKLIAGVCSGIGNYFGVNAWIPRALFLLPFLSFVFHNLDFVRFSFSPGSLIVYIILWLAIPEASTTSEKLEMKGEKVDMNSIKNSVVEEMKGVQQRVGKFAQEAGTVAGEKASAMGSDIKAATRRSGTSLGDVILFIVKAFAYFIIGCVAFGLVIGLFVFSVFSIGVFPLKDFILTDGWQNVFAWGTLLFFIAVPVIGVITWIIRRIAKMRSNRTVLRFSFISLWIIGWACFICLIASVSKDFRSVNTFSENDVPLSNPAVNKLIVANNSPIKNSYRYNTFRLEPFRVFDEDTVFVRNIDIKIVKSPTDSFKVTLIKMVHGQNKRFADTLASRIKFNVVQNDSTLVLDKGIAITREEKFRNQRVVLTVYVPVGKQIKIDRNFGWGNYVHFDGPWNEGDMYIDRDDEERGWETNVDYVMRADGLYTLGGKKASETDHDNDPNWDDDNDRDDNGVKMKSEGDGYRYKQDPVKKVDSMKANLDSTRQSVKDSLKKEIEKMNQQLQKIEGKTKTATEAMVIYPSPLFLQINSF